MSIPEVLHTAIAGDTKGRGADGAKIYYSGANREYPAWTRTVNHSSFRIPVHETFLDLVFWHALGRALGWDAPCALTITCGAR